MKIRNIIIGWGKRFGFLPTSGAEKKLSQLRMRQCSGCPDSIESTALKIINGEGVYEHRLACTRCKCPCLEKSIVVEEYCPIGKW